MKSQQLPNPALALITPADVQKVFRHIKSYKGAWFRIQKVKDALGKKKHQGVTVAEFADWEGLDVSIILTTIYFS